MKFYIAFLLLTVGVVLDEVHGQTEERPAIPFEPCFAWIKPIPKCPINERYTCCKPCIEPSCRTQVTCVKCRPCSGGCICLDGYIRITPNGRCIPIAECRKIEIFY